MIYIEILKTRNFKIKNHEYSSDFFLDFFTKIDDFNLANLYLVINKVKTELDFGFDFLSIYDFLDLSIDYLNENKMDEIFTLLLYERGSDKLEFKILNKENVKITYFKKEKKNIEIFDIIKLKKIFLDLILKLKNIFSQVTTDNNSLFYDWIIKLEKSIQISNL